MVERQEQPILVVESVKGASELSALDRAVEVIGLEADRIVQLGDKWPLADPDRRPNDVAAEPCRERVGIAKAIETAPGR
jgi:hypothetical protein